MKLYMASYFIELAIVIIIIINYFSQTCFFIIKAKNKLEKKSMYI
jgi:hypothetical protein